MCRNTRFLYEIPQTPILYLPEKNVTKNCALNQPQWENHFNNFVVTFEIFSIKITRAALESWQALGPHTNNLICLHKSIQRHFLRCSVQNLLATFSSTSENPKKGSGLHDLSPEPSLSSRHYLRYLNGHATTVTWLTSVLTAGLAR